MTDKTKSLIRHALTALGGILAFLGLAKFSGFFDILNDNFDNVWAAGATVVGFITAIIGFFKNKERFAGIALLLFCSNFLFASDIQIVRPIASHSSDNYHQSGCASFYALSCGESVLLLE